MLQLSKLDQESMEAKRLAKLEPSFSFEQSRKYLLSQMLTKETEINRHTA
jgi:hypothetical protein